MVDVVDLLDPVVLLQRHRVEAALVAVAGERRLEAGEALDRRAGADELVLLQDGEAVEVLDRDRPSRRSSRWPGPWPRGPATRRRTRRRPRGDQPSRVAMRSAPMPCGTNEVSSAVAGSLAQAPPSEPIGTRLIDSTPPARIRSSQPERIRAAAWLTASRPEAQNRLSCTPRVGLGVAGRERGGLGDVAALVADRGDHAEHHVVDARRGRSRRCACGPRRAADHQVDRLHLVEGAVLLALAPGGADRVVHECLRLLGHEVSQLSGDVGAAIDCDTHAVKVVNHGPCDLGRCAQPNRARGPDDRTPTELQRPPQLLTLDELTDRVGMSVRNIRFYTTKGLVPPPIRRGRSGYYSADHVPGSSWSASCRRTGSRCPRSRSTSPASRSTRSPETIALHRTLLAPWMAELPESVSAARAGPPGRVGRCPRTTWTRSTRSASCSRPSRASTRSPMRAPAGRRRAARPRDAAGRRPGRAGHLHRARPQGRRGAHRAVPHQGVAGRSRRATATPEQLREVRRAVQAGDHLRPWSTAYESAVNETTARDDHPPRPAPDPRRRAPAGRGASRARVGHPAVTELASLETTHLGGSGASSAQPRKPLCLPLGGFEAAAALRGSARSTMPGCPGRGGPMTAFLPRAVTLGG